MEPIARATHRDFEALAGLSVDAVFQADGYWHFFVALRCANGSSIVFNTEDVGVAKYFEVFPLRVKVEETGEREWKPVGHARTIQAVRPLWRDEWLEPTEPHPETVGSEPHHVHRAGRGPVPVTAVAHALVQAGVELVFESGESMVVLASNTAPFNVELAASPSEVQNVLLGFNEAAA